MYTHKELLSLERVQEIISQHKSLELSDEAKINIQNGDFLDKKMASIRTYLWY
jgi:histidine ammonia-lyase